MYVVLNMCSTLLSFLELTINITYEWVLIDSFKELTGVDGGVIKCAQGTDGLNSWHGRLGRLRLL